MLETYRSLNYHLSPAHITFLNEKASFQTPLIKSIKLARDAYPFDAGSLYEIKEPSELWVEVLTKRFPIIYENYRKTKRWFIPSTERRWIEEHFDVNPTDLSNLKEVEEIYNDII